MHENHAVPTTEVNWDQLRPVLHEAMHQLEDSDREALLLRFFQNRDLRAVGSVLGVSDDAARKRVERALDKLRSGLLRRGINSTSAALGTVLTSAGVAIAPKGLSASIASAVFLTSLTSTTTRLLTMTKLKIGISTALLVAGLGTMVLTRHHANKRVKTGNDQLTARSVEVEALPDENAQLAKGQAPSEKLERLQESRRELMKLRGRTQSKRAAGTNGQNCVD